MEYLKVTFDAADIRRVLADGNDIGATETVLLVTPNYYVITLSETGYAPPQWAGVVSGTTSDAPLIITFRPAPASPVAHG